MERDHTESNPGHWSITTRLPTPWLRPDVIAFADYAKRVNGVLRRHELPTTRITLIIVLDGPLEVKDGAGERLRLDGGGFLAGIHDAPALTTAIGHQRGMEVRLTPLGAHRLLRDVSMAALANRAVDLTMVLGPGAPELVERLHSLPTPDERLSLLERSFADRLLRTASPRSELRWAWDQLQASHGDVAITMLAEELGWSRKRLVATFRQTVGVPPKLAAQILRFERVLDLATASAAQPVDWAALATRGGYYDQSHLVREVRRFTGRTPGQLLRDWLPADLGFGTA